MEKADERKTRIVTRSDSSDPIFILKTKLNRPQVHSGLVSRSHLLQQLDGGLDGLLTLVSAPAGFGKTTLVSSWVENITADTGDGSTPIPVAWLSLDENDSDLRTFISYFIAALRTIFPEVCPETLFLLRSAQQPLQDRIFTTLSNEIEGLPWRFVMVLDDYHTLRGQAVHDLFNEMVLHWPPPMHLVLISRSSPPLPLAGLRAKGMMAEIRSHDLRFSQDEQASYLERVLDRPPSQPLLDLLDQRIEGWITGLQLTTLSLRSAGRAENLMDTLSGAEGDIAEYLVDEVLTRQLPAIQTFLLKTSILDHFCAPLCEAVVGEIDKAWDVRACMEWIERSNLFVTALDQRKEWYRYHSLFRELLQHRLQVMFGKSLVNELQRRAAVWFAGQNLLDQALQHAQDAQDLELTIQLMKQGLNEVLNRQDQPVLARWLRLLPEEVIQRNPWLLMIRAWALQFVWGFDLQIKALQQIEELLDSNEDKSMSEEDRQILRGQILGLKAQQLYYSNQTTRAIELCHQALALLPFPWLYVRGGVTLYLGLSMHASGQGLEAERLLLGEYESCGDKSNTYGLYLLLTLCNLHYKNGQIEQVRRIAQVLLEGANHGRLAILQSWTYYFLGLVYYHLNELEAATQHFTWIVENRYIAQATALHQAVAGLVSIHIIQRENSKAWRMVEIISQLDLERRGSEEDSTRSLRARLMLLNGDLEGAGQWADTFTDPPPNKSLVWLEEPQVTRARILIARGSPADLWLALQILDVLGEITDRTYNTRYKIEILALRALVLDAQGETDLALAELQQALDLAHPGGFIRLFVDLGLPMQALLREIASQSSPSEYIQHILDAFPGTEGGAESRSAQSTNMKSGLVEPLTSREFEILDLMRRPMSNKEIALQLGISYATVKRHQINLYGKLDVNSRWEAVSKAADLGIFSPS